MVYKHETINFRGVLLGSLRYTVYDSIMFSQRTFVSILCEHGERGHLIGNAVAEPRAVRCNAGTVGMVYVELKRGLYKTQIPALVHC